MEKIGLQWWPNEAPMGAMFKITKQHTNADGTIVIDECELLAVDGSVEHPVPDPDYLAGHPKVYRNDEEP